VSDGVHILFNFNTVFKHDGMSSIKINMWSYIVTKFCFPWCNSPQWVRASSL